MPEIDIRPAVLYQPESGGIPTASGKPTLPFFLSLFTMNSTNPKVDAYLSRTAKWREESVKLREIALGSGPLTEELKWGKPCYTFQDSNILIIQGFKDYCALMFCKGALLKDRDGLLQKPGENTQAARQLRFGSVEEISELEPLVKVYIREAIAAEKAGLEVEFKTTPEPTPAELQELFDDDPDFKAAFNALTPGRQRAYILHFAAPKQSKTRTSRIGKCRPQILAGKGLNDR
ncbi:MAG: hypothetical protein JWO82_1540 [Akkermansiaceae bacterium]|nr:hypothetical protein [Akkermansiaceae bacterium]